MEFPIPPDVRTTAPREPQSQRELQRNLGARLHLLLILVMLTSLTSSGCAFARLILILMFNLDGISKLFLAFISLLDLGGGFVIQAICLLGLLGGCCKLNINQLSLGWTLNAIVLISDATAVNLVRFIGSSKILSLSAVIL